MGRYKHYKTRDIRLLSRRDAMHTANITKVQNTGQSRVTVNMTVLVIVIAFFATFLFNITTANSAGNTITTSPTRTTVVDRSDALKAGGQIGSVRTQHSSDTTLAYPQYVRAGEPFQYQRCVTKAYFAEVGVYATSINKVDIDGTSASFTESKTQTSSNVDLSLCKTYTANAPAVGSTTLSIPVASVTQFGAIGYSGTCCPGTGFSWSSSTLDNTLNFLQVYTPPQANDDGTFTLEKGTSYELSPLTNDYGVTGAQGANNASIIDRAITVQATKGTCTWDEATSKITYTNNGTAGSDSCKYSFNQANTNAIGPSNLAVNATINFMVTSDPTALDDTAATDQNSDVTIDVLANDHDDDGDEFSLQTASSPTGFGTVSISQDKVVFSPGTDFIYLATGESDEVLVSYTIIDARGKTSSATIAVTVNGLNDSPTALVDSASTDKNSTVTIKPLTNDSDPDTNDILTLTSANVINGNGSLAIENDKVIYDPGTAYGNLQDGQSETVTIEYVISDNHGATSTSTITVTIAGIDDPIIPPHGIVPLDPISPFVPVVPDAPTKTGNSTGPTAPTGNQNTTGYLDTENKTNVDAITPKSEIGKTNDKTIKTNKSEEKRNAEVLGESIYNPLIVKGQAQPAALNAKNPVVWTAIAIVSSIMLFWFILVAKRRDDDEDEELA